MNPDKLTAMLNRYSQRLADTEMQAASALADAQLERQRADRAEAKVKELEAAAEKPEPAVKTDSKAKP